MFINFMCEPDVGKANAEYIGYTTPMQAVCGIFWTKTSSTARSPIPPRRSRPRKKVFTALSDEVNSELDVKWSEMKSYDEGGSGYLFLMLLAGDAGSGLLQHLAQGAQENAQYVLILRGLCGGVQPLFIKEREKNDE